jgi:hypothetical protein
MLRTFVIAAVLALTLTAAGADETLKFSSILHATFLESQDVGDVDGHAMSLTRYSGLTRFSDGTAGLCYLVASVSGRCVQKKIARRRNELIAKGAMNTRE